MQRRVLNKLIRIEVSGSPSRCSAPKIQARMTNNTYSHLNTSTLTRLLKAVPKVRIDRNMDRMSANEIHLMAFTIIIRL